MAARKPSPNRAAVVASSSYTAGSRRDRTVRAAAGGASRLEAPAAAPTAGEEWLGVPVVVACELDPLRAAGDPPGQAHRRHRGFGPAVHEPHQLAARYALRDRLGQFHLARGGRPVTRAVGGRGSDCGDDGGGRVSEDQRALALPEVGVTVALDIPHVRSFSAPDRVGSPANGTKRPHRRTDAAGDDARGALEHLHVVGEPESAAQRRLAAGRRTAVGVAEVGHAVSTSASSAARYVRMTSAPARFTAVICSSATAGPSIQPRAAAALIIEYSPDTWYAAMGTSTAARTRAITSRYVSAGFTITMSAPWAMSACTSRIASRPLCQSCW